MDQKTMKEIQSQTEYLLNKRLMKRRWALGVAALAVLVAGSVGVGLRYVGQAMNHTTTEMVCEVVGSDTLAHQHNEYCFNATGELICTLEEREEHVHTDECYETECILICGFEEAQDSVDAVEADGELAEGETADATEENAAEAANQHIHTPECYEYKKTLICDKVETTEAHIHGDGCVVTRELTEAEKAALDRAKKYELDPNKEYTKSFEDDKYLITVSYMGTAGIPEQAELRVVRLEENDELYDELVANGIELIEEDTELNYVKYDKETETLTVYQQTQYDVLATLDIGFYLNDEEIEPNSDVKVVIQFLNKENVASDVVDDEAVESKIAVIHTHGEESTLVESETDEAGEQVEFSVDSFSYYTVIEETSLVKEAKDLPAGQYGKTKLEYNNTKNAFLSDAYKIYRVENGAFGEVASSFHVVAFDTATLASHCNGNILAKNLKGSNNFGTNGYSNELSYIQNVFDHSDGMESGGGNNKVAVVGSKHTMLYDQSSVFVASEQPIGNNGNAKVYQNLVKATDSSATTFIKDIDTAKAPFIDLADVEREVNSYSSSYAGMKNVNVVVDKDKHYIKLTDPNVAGYYNITADELNSWANSTDWALVGFECDIEYGPNGSISYQNAKEGSLIINVDCSNITANSQTGSKTIKIPTRSIVYFNSKFNADGSLDLNNKGVQAPTGEVVDFSAGRVIWNFYNAKEGTKIELDTITGSVVAPKADVDANKMNGNIIAKNVKISGETHRTDFKGTTKPAEAQFYAKKKVDGATPTDGQTFEFVLEQSVNGKIDKNPNWKELERVTSDAVGNVEFSPIVYDKEGTYWYRIREIDTGLKNYEYDKSGYIIKAVVTKKASTKDKYSFQYDVEYTRYLVEDALSFNGSELKTTVDAENVVFNNKKSKTITVNKKWLNYNDNALVSTDDFQLPEAKVQLYKTTSLEKSDADAKVGELVTLNADNNYTYSWKNLPVKENGLEITYYVKEEPVEGFELVYNSIYRDVITLKNKQDMTSVSAQKRFVDLDDNDVTATVADGTVSFRLMYSTDKGNTWATADKFDLFDGSVPLVSYGDAQAVPQSSKSDTLGRTVPKGTYTVDSSCGWKLLISNLPRMDRNGNPVVYKLVEAESTVENYLYKYSFDDKSTVYGIEPEVTTDEAGENFIVTNRPQLAEITVKKTWLTYSGGVDSLQVNGNADAFIIFALKADGNIKAYYKMTYNSVTEVRPQQDGTYTAIGDELPTYEINELSDMWTMKLVNMPAKKLVNGQLEDVAYSIEEVDCYDGYENTAVNVTSNNSVNPYSYTFELVNTSTLAFELPKTGGSGTLAYRLSRLLSGKALN